MILNHQDLTVREAELKDQEPLGRFLQGKPFIHQHLGWQPPLAWLGKQPYLILEVNKKISSVLACPSDEDGITWLRLFAVSSEYSVWQAWTILWPLALKWLQENTSNQQVNSLVIRDKMLDILKKSGFQEGYRVVVLVWDISQARWPALESKVLIREMGRDDYARVYKVDQEAFEPIWRNSLGHIKIAHQEASSATIATVDDRVVGYQISTINPQGGHLARLAVTPEFQNFGVGAALVEDLLTRFQQQGIVQVSVNTQARNQASLVLYHKFGFEKLDEVYLVYQYNLGKKEKA
jgi:ribosomal-protein-alanine N-acetyltransferase